MASPASASNPVTAAESPASGGSSSCSWLSPASLPHAHNDGSGSLQYPSFPNLNRTSLLLHYRVIIRGRKKEHAFSNPQRSPAKAGEKEEEEERHAS